MNELVLKMLEGPPRVYYAPIGWISYEQWYFFPLEEWYHFLLVEVKRVETLAESEWKPPSYPMANPRGRDTLSALPHGAGL